MLLLRHVLSLTSVCTGQNTTSTVCSTCRDHVAQSVHPIHLSTTVLTQAETPDLLTQEVIDAFLQVHNDARANVSLPPLVCNKTLSNYAADWGSNCIWNHSYGKYGENIFSSYDDGDNVLVAKSAVKLWNSEIANVDIPDWNCFKIFGDKTCGHYSQVVWRDSQRVGCAITHCKSVKKLKNFVVCSYDPRGNMKGKKPY
ncbi:hypothetical protein Btru_077980 [Bulinus truncatus]|nr:hypothetical protein Btru_077980 [Bulinus truncatus]